MNKFYVISIVDSAGVTQSYGIVAAGMTAAIAAARTLAGLDSDVDPQSTQVLYPHVDHIVS